MSEPVNKPLRDAAMTYLKNQAGEDAKTDRGFPDLWAKVTKAAVRGGEGIAPEEQEGLGKINKAYSLHFAAKTADSALELHPVGALIDWLRGEEAEREEAEIGRRMDLGEVTMAEAALLAASAPDRPLAVLPPAPAHLNFPPHVGLDAGAFLIDVLEGSIHLRDPLRGRHLVVSRQAGTLMVMDNDARNVAMLEADSNILLNVQSAKAFILLETSGDVLVIKGQDAVSVEFPRNGQEGVSGPAQPVVRELARKAAVDAVDANGTGEKTSVLRFEDLADMTETVAEIVGDGAP